MAAGSSRNSGADLEAGGLDRWRIGGLYYGRLYDGKKRTDLNLLERAVQDHGIGCVKQSSRRRGDDGARSTGPANGQA